MTYGTRVNFNCRLFFQLVGHCHNLLHFFRPKTTAAARRQTPGRHKQELLQSRHVICSFALSSFSMPVGRSCAATVLTVLCLCSIMRCTLLKCTQQQRHRYLPSDRGCCPTDANEWSCLLSPSCAESPSISEQRLIYSHVDTHMCTTRPQFSSFAFFALPNRLHKWITRSLSITSSWPYWSI